MLHAIYIDTNMIAPLVGVKHHSRNPSNAFAISESRIDEPKYKAYINRIIL
jgi:hypothetical protein